jgi:hypothetical protein
VGAASVESTAYAATFVGAAEFPCGRRELSINTPGFLIPFVGYGAPKARQFGGGKFIRGNRKQKHPGGTQPLQDSRDLRGSNRSSPYAFFGPFFGFFGFFLVGFSGGIALIVIATLLFDCLSRSSLVPPPPEHKHSRCIYAERIGLSNRLRCEPKNRLFPRTLTAPRSNLL